VRRSVLDEGLGIAGTDLRTEFCLDDLLRMDSKTLAEVEGVKVQRGIASPNEARAKFNLPEAEGGDSPMVQQQNYSLAALAKRDASADPFGKIAAAPVPAPTPVPPEDGEDPAASAEDVERAVEAGIGKVIATVKADAETSLAEVSRLISASVAEVEQRMNARAEHERQVQEEAAARLQEFGDALTRRIARATSEA